MAYMNCKYYDKLNELVKQRVPETEILAQAIQILDEELDGAGCDWLLHHYNSNAGHMVDEICYGNGMNKTEFDLSLKYAELEISVFRKHGFHSEADSIQKMLDDAVKAFTQA